MPPQIVGVTAEKRNEILNPKPSNLDITATATKKKRGAGKNERISADTVVTRNMIAIATSAAF